jgi:hypothetical protein
MVSLSRAMVHQFHANIRYASGRKTEDGPEGAAEAETRRAAAASSPAGSAHALIGFARRAIAHVSFDTSQVPITPGKNA